MTEFVVVDASLAVKWLVDEDDSDKAHAVLESWVTHDVTRIAPYLMPFEVANVLHRRVLRGELSVSNGARMMTRLLGSRLELHQSTGLHVRALELASQLSQGGSMTPTTWRWQRSLAANCGPPTRSSTGRQRPAGTFTG